MFETQTFCKLSDSAASQGEHTIVRRATEELIQSEERLRDLFDEAPIAYVYENVDSRIVRANHAASRILGVSPEEITGMFRRSLVPDTPEAQRRLHEVREAMARGTETSGRVLEMRRKDNGRPLWIRLWSRPVAGAKYTRTMFIDVTDQVMSEQQNTLREARNAGLLDEIRGEQNFGDIIGASS